MTSVHQNRFIAQRHLRNRVGTALSTTSVVIRDKDTQTQYSREAFFRGGISYRQPCRGVVVTERHRRKRRQWIQNNIGRRWRDVVFSDESRFKISKADGRVSVER